MPFRPLTLLALVALLVSLFFEELSWHSTPSFIACDVGQGDGLIVSSGGYQIVVDGGPDQAFLSCLGSHMPFFDRTIDLLVLSHPHLDHLQSFPELLRRYRIAAVLFTGVDYPQPRYEEFLTLLADEGAQIVVADPLKDLDVGNLHVNVLWPPPDYFGRKVKEVHETCTVIRVSVNGGKSVLLPGDLERSEETALLQTGTDVRADILKVGHHGSRTSSSTGFLLAVRPSVGVVSVAAENSYGLPDEDVLARYATFGIPLRLTMEEGTIRIPLR